MATPNFQSPQINPFGLSNVGLNSSPDFADIDRDGDLDAFVGDSNGNIRYFQNTGSANSPSFAAARSNPFGLSDVGTDSSPSFFSFGSASYLNALVGSENGTIFYFRNTGTVSSPSFAAPVSNPFALSRPGARNSSPTLVDINGDRILDAFVGDFNGNIYYYQGVRNGSNFAAVQTNPFGLSDVGNYSSPDFADIDGDGDLDAFVGDFNGNTYYFQNTGNFRSPSFAPAVSNPFGLSDVGSISSPTLVDIDGDGDLDAFIGNVTGNIQYFQNNSTPTAINFSNTSALAENSDTTNRIKVADITITDDRQGTNNLSFSGTDAASFELLGTSLYLKAGTILDYETKQSYSITVAVDDPTIGTTPDLTRVFTLNVTNINEAPTAVNFSNTVTEIAENSNTTSPIKVADIIVTDDALGTNNLTLSGTAADTAAFEIVGGSLYIRTGTVLDFETKPVYTVTVNVDDPTLGSSPDLSRTFTLNLADITDNLPFLVTNTNDSGVGSLRWAIDNANRASNPQTIDFDPSLTGQTINLSSGALQITDSVRINADIDENGTADITVDAGGTSRVLEISANRTVVIEGMVLRGGSGDGVGGIFNSGNLTLRNSSVSNNFGIGNTGLGGGGIYNNGSNSILDLLSSTISNNTTTERGGGIYNNGGRVMIANSRIESNVAELGGGGIYNNGGSVIVNDSTFDSNTSNTIGGGLVNDNGTTTLNSATLINNTATDTVSGAIFNNGSTLGLGSVVTLNGGTVSGGIAANTINSGLLVINGTDNGESLQGSSGVDQISGLEGDDLLQGFQGNDTLVGGDGNDTVNGGDNNDLLQGGAGNDLLGGLGGTDQMEGGTGNDTYTVNNAAATLIEAVGEGTDTVRSQISWSLDSNFENLTLLGAGNLNSTGNDIINTLTGNGGNNILDGKSSNDRLIGNGGDDVLIGGAGADTVTGGNGNDRFVFNAISEGGDRITDFTANSDQIGVSAAGFGAGLSVGTLLASQFAIGTMTTTDQRFLYDTATGSLFFDSNGSAADGRTRIATLTAQPSISANDIVVVA